jgi:hypothetical protein
MEMRRGLHAQSDCRQCLDGQTRTLPAFRLLQLRAHDCPVISREEEEKEEKPTKYEEKRKRMKKRFIYYLYTERITQQRLCLFLTSLNHIQPPPSFRPFLTSIQTTLSANCFVLTHKRDETGCRRRHFDTRYTLYP